MQDVITEVTESVEARAETAPTQPEWQTVAVVEDTPEQAVKAADQLRKLAPEYRLRFDQAKRAESDYKSLRSRMTYHFAIYKAIHVGKGRDGNWKNFVEEELKLAVRTVDRWIADKVKLASGELPAWVVAKLKDNMDPEPEPEEEAKERPLELKLVGLTEDEKIAFNQAMDQFQPDVVSRIIFDAVTKHMALLEPNQPEFDPDPMADKPEPEPKPMKSRLAFGTEETEGFSPKPTRERHTFVGEVQLPPTIASDLEHRAAMEARA